MVMGMTKTTTYCDHCGKELNDMNDYIECEITIGYTEFYYDLCEECYTHLLKMAKDFCSCGERKDHG